MLAAVLCNSTHTHIYEKLKIIAMFLLNYTFREWSYCGFGFILVGRLEYFVPTFF